jgi:CelD/BcsL family acetyltransferase involved in cellulose biosynthesis
LILLKNFCACFEFLNRTARLGADTVAGAAKGIPVFEMVSVEIRAPDVAMIPAWDDLARRAEPNAFMHPAALSAANESGFARVHALLAWDEGAPRKLVGFWGLREQRVAPFVSYLAAPPYEFCFVASPVIDPAHADAAMPAFLDAIANAKLPNVMKLKYLDGSADAHGAMMRALSARNSEVLTLCERERPFLSGEGERKRSGSTGKKLRQDWNRLSSLGAADVVNDRTSEGARAAFETFHMTKTRRSRAPSSRGWARMAAPRSRCCASTRKRSPRRCCCMQARRPTPGRPRSTRSSPSIRPARS